MSLVAVDGDAITGSGKSVFTSAVAPNKRRFLIAGLNGASLNQTSLPGGTLVKLLLYVNPKASAGVHALTFSNLVATNADGGQDIAASTDGSVTVLATSGQGVRLQQTGVVNGASLLPGPVAPGEFLRLAGSSIAPSNPIPGSTIPGATMVFFDGIRAPLLATAPDQIDLIVPYGISGKLTTQMNVMSGAQLLASLTLPVAASAPGVFTLDPTGIGHAGVLNQDGTPNSASNPALRGTAVTLFATGLGQTSPSGVDGKLAWFPLPMPLLPVSVRVGGVESQALYDSAVLDYIAGLHMVVCRIPTNMVPGPAVPLLLQVGTAASQPGVTVAVK